MAHIAFASDKLSRLLVAIANLPPTTVGTRVCLGRQHLARFELSGTGIAKAVS